MISAAFDGNLTHYKPEIPQLGWFKALSIAANAMTNHFDSCPPDPPRL